MIHFQRLIDNKLEPNSGHVDYGLIQMIELFHNWRESKAIDSVRVANTIITKWNWNRVLTCAL